MPRTKRKRHAVPQLFQNRKTREAKRERSATQTAKETERERDREKDEKKVPRYHRSDEGLRGFVSAAFTFPGFVDASFVLLK